MADITMCANKNCIKEDTCYRKKAKPDKYSQSFSYFEQCEENNWCEYLEINNSKEIEKL
jgi:hypothetical protein